MPGDEVMKDAEPVKKKETKKKDDKPKEEVHAVA